MMSKSRHAYVNSPALKQSGVSLLEILVAVFIISLGLLGLGGLQATGLRNNTGAYYRSQAALFAFDMTDRMRANAAAALAGDYNLAIGNSAPAGTSLPDVDRREWLALLSTLPSGDGAINVAADGTVTVSLQWDDRRADPDNPIGSLVINTRL